MRGVSAAVHFPAAKLFDVVPGVQAARRQYVQRVLIVLFRDLDHFRREQLFPLKVQPFAVGHDGIRAGLFLRKAAFPISPVAFVVAGLDDLGDPLDAFGGALPGGIQHLFGGAGRGPAGHGESVDLDVGNIDGATKGDSLVVKFYDGTSDHTYTASKKWNENGGDFWGDVKAMCRMLSARGLPAKDLILGTDVADYILTDERTRQLLDKNSGIIVGEIRQQLTQYDGVVFMGTLNFGGFMLNVFSVDETYEDETGKSARYFPATAAMVTAPDCGHMMYGSITQMDYGKTDYTSYAAKRVAKLVVDQDKDTRKLRLGCRPLAAPKTYCPYIYAADVVG